MVWALQWVGRGGSDSKYHGHATWKNTLRNINCLQSCHCPHFILAPFLVFVLILANFRIIILVIITQPLSSFSCKGTKTSTETIIRLKEHLIKAAIFD